MAAPPGSRRSARATKPNSTASGKPAAPASKPAPATNKKRRAADDDDEREPEKPRSKRAKNGKADAPVKPVKTTVEKKKSAAPSKKTNAAAAPKKPAAPRKIKAPLNLVPDFSSSLEAENPNQMFVWGAGNFGQFGMGSDYQDEFDKPKKNNLIEKKTSDGEFGDGIAVIAAGGMHTMFIDSNGSVSQKLNWGECLLTEFWIGMDMWS